MPVSGISSKWPVSNPSWWFIYFLKMTFKKICKYHFCFKRISLFYKQDNAASVTNPRPKFIFNNAEPAQLALVVTACVLEYFFF